MVEELFFESIKEHCGSYFVEYHPPAPSMSLATLYLVFVDLPQPDQAAILLEAEVRRWLARYPVPLMASALDEKEDPIPVHGSQGGKGSSLFAWFTPDTSEIVLSRKPGDLDAFLENHPLKLNLQDIYADIPFRTKAHVKANVDKYVKERRRQNLILKCLLTIWLVVIPGGVALFEYFGPEWLGLSVLLFSLWKAWRIWLKLTGRAKPSRAETEEAEKERKMRHYYYHCERNPLGFQRLMVENFQEDTRQRVREEAEELKKEGPPQSL